MSTPYIRPAGRASASVPVEELMVGMVVGDDVLDRNGRLLLPAGTEVTERHSRALQMWGITAVPIETDADGAQAPLAEPEDEDVARAEDELRALLCFNDLNHPMIAELLDYCALRQAYLVVAARLERGDA